MNAEATLREWLKGPAGLGDEDLIPPDAATIERAIRLWRALQDRGSDEPLRVVPDGEAGIVFEWYTQDSVRLGILDSDGRARCETFKNGELVTDIEIGY